MLFIFLVLVLIIGCAEKQIIDEEKGQAQEENQATDTGVEDVFGEEADIEPPQAPS